VFIYNVGGRLLPVPAGNREQKLASAPVCRCSALHWCGAEQDLISRPGAAREANASRDGGAANLLAESRFADVPSMPGAFLIQPELSFIRLV
jgi:hypothetical protein